MAKVNNCWIKVEDGTTILFDPSFDHVYAPEYRLCGVSEEAVNDHVRALGLPAPSKFLTSETPKDDKKLIEVLKSIDNLPNLPDGENVDKFELSKSANEVLPTIDTVKFSKLYNGDKDGLKEVFGRLGITKNTTFDSVPHRPKVESEEPPKTRRRRVVESVKTEESTVKSEEPVKSKGSTAKSVKAEEPVVKVDEPAKTEESTVKTEESTVKVEEPVKVEESEEYKRGDTVKVEEPVKAPRTRRTRVDRASRRRI